MMSSSEVRTRFLDYFQRHGHTVVASSALIPGNDPTLLFTNAGMVQFKEVFLGQEQRAYRRAVTSQRCVRAGGKHNDLENVGYTARHHTFFEMLGNFSFGDYFKADAIRLAWQFVTAELGIPADKLCVTVFETDDEAFDLWQQIAGLPPQRITRMGADSNFWSMGDTGPCGPCSEIFYDHGAHIPGGPPGSPDEDGDRFVEIWNLVFMQYERAADGSLTPLPKPSVDTGMGLERISAVMQGVHSNYDIDLFQALIQAAAQAVGTQDRHSPSLRVIADHIRACGFLLSDGVIPANEGRGYVLRRIIRRAIRHGYKLGQSQPFLHELVTPLVTLMGAAYPELITQAGNIRAALKAEETRFAETLKEGMVMLDSAIAELAATGAKVIAGETVFKLYDTYGFPADLTNDVARERQLSIDSEGFEAAMTAQRERARAANRFAVDMRDAVQLDAKTEFDGDDIDTESVTVVALLDEHNQPVTQLVAPAKGSVVLNRTPFYAEGGGQVGDTGSLRDLQGQTRFNVADTQKHRAAFVHVGTLVQGVIRVAQTLEAEIDRERRQAIRRNHSATHLLHAALRQILGTHVQQKGSLVDAERLRFDFAHFEPISASQLAEVEAWVNHEILQNAATVVRQMSYPAAIEAGAMALFGEKYGDTVRVLRLGDNSTELCGGTHVRRTGDIGVFKIVAEAGVAAGVRRIEALSGTTALAYLNAANTSLDWVSAQLKTNRAELGAKLESVLERAKRLEREVTQLKLKLASGQSAESAVQTIAGTQLLVKQVDGMDAKSLRVVVDQAKQTLGSGIVVVGSVDEAQKATLLVGVTSDLSERFKAGELAGFVAAQLGGKGGGRADFAQAGGPEGDKLAQALASVPGWISAHG
jgi:alanyl-tRNA synthetase